MSTKNKGYLVPENINPEEEVGFCVPVPNDPAYIRAVMGQLSDLGGWGMWEKEPDHKAVQAATRWRDSYQRISDCEPCEDCDCQECEECCMTIYPDSPLIDYAPNDPFRTPDHVPFGWTVPPWYLDDGRPSTNFFRLPPFVGLPAIITGFPRFKVHCKGEGIAYLYLRKMPQGGYAYITVDGQVDSSMLVSMASFQIADFDTWKAIIISIIGGTITGGLWAVDIIEVKLEGEGDHYIDVTALPAFNTNVIVGFGMELEKVKICTNTAQEIPDEDMPPQFRTVDCLLQWRPNDDADWVTLQDLRDCCCDDEELNEMCWLWELNQETYGFTAYDENSGHWEDTLGWVDGVSESGVRKVDIVSEEWANYVRVTDIKVTGNFTAGEDGANHFIQVHTDTGWVTVLDDDSPSEGAPIEVVVSGEWMANQVRVRFTTGDDEDGSAVLYSIQVNADLGETLYPDLPCEDGTNEMCWLWELYLETYGFLPFDEDSGHWENTLGWVDGLSESGLRKVDIVSEEWANYVRVTDIKVSGNFTAGEDGANHFIQVHTDTGWVTVLDDDSPSEGEPIEVVVTGEWMANRIRVRFTTGNDEDGSAVLYSIQVNADLGETLYPELPCEDEPPTGGCFEWDFTGTDDFGVTSIFGHQENGVGWVSGTTSGTTRCDFSFDWVSFLHVTKVEVDCDFHSGTDTNANQYISLNNAGTVVILDDFSPVEGDGIMVTVDCSEDATGIRVSFQCSDNDEGGSVQVYKVRVFFSDGTNPFPELECA